MRVVRHDHAAVDPGALFVIVKAAIKGDVSLFRGELATGDRHKRNKVRLPRPRQMQQTPVRDMRIVPDHGNDCPSVYSV
jgi:hypothetical protein